MQPFLDGTLSVDEVAQAEKHLDGCSVVFEAVSLRGAPAPLRARRGQRADVARAERGLAALRTPLT